MSTMLATPDDARLLPFPTSAAADRRERDWERLTSGLGDARQRLAIVSGRRDLDAHAHVFHAADGAVPGARYAPTHDAPMAAWSLHLLSAGLVGGTLVQPSFLGFDNTRMLAAMQTGHERGLLVTGSAVVPMDAPAAQFEALARKGCVSVRLNLMKLALPDFTSREWSLFARRARDAGLAIEVHLEHERAASLVAAILREGACVIVDHYGLAPGADALSAVLGDRDLDRVFVKASAPYRLPCDPSTGGNPAALAARLLDRAVATVGEPNVMWGSDWPHTQHAMTFAQSLALNAGPGSIR